MHRSSIQKDIGNDVNRKQSRRQSKAIKAKSHAQQDLSIDVFGAKLKINRAFGSNCLPTDAIQAYSVLNATIDKDTNDKLVYRVGSHLCVHDLDTAKQQFFQTKGKSSKSVLHFTLGVNNKYVSVCESIRFDKDDEGHAQISIYSLQTLAHYKTLSYECKADFVQSIFCGDPKYLASLTGEYDRQIVVWNWEKEKTFRTISLTMNITCLRAGPSQTLMLTTSGRGVMKSWYLGTDGLKFGHLLQANREQENFLDHVWLPSGGTTTYRMVALGDLSDEVIHNAVQDANAVVSKKQNILIFEGTDTANTQSTTSAPISLELKQTIAVKIRTVDPTSLMGLSQNGFGNEPSFASIHLPKVEAIIPSSKGFILVGGSGFVATFER
jgi:hypothetical protein